MEGAELANFPQKIRVFIFEDAAAATASYKEVFSHSKVDLEFQENAVIDEPSRRKIVDFQPQLFIVDLVMGGSRDDGIKLIKELSRIEEVSGVPIVVCSKLISETTLGIKQKDEVKRLPGVVDALPKFPYPSAESFLKHARFS